MINGRVRWRLSIEDRFALQDLIAANAWALDTGDIEALVACFTTDAQLEHRAFNLKHTQQL